MADFDRQKFWKDPEHSGFSKEFIANRVPEYFLEFHAVSAMFVDALKRFAKPPLSILEIGCGTGRNLAALKAAGFENVSGIEISQHAIEVGRARFPEYKDIPVINAPVEDVIKDTYPVDVIFTQSCLMHLPFELNWVLEEIGKKAQRLIVTFEGELSRGESIDTWRRDYQKVFEPLGWHQVEMAPGNTVPPAPPTTIKRIFLPNTPPPALSTRMPVEEVRVTEQEPAMAPEIPAKVTKTETLHEIIGHVKDPEKAPVKTPVAPKRVKTK